MFVDERYKIVLISLQLVPMKSFIRNGVVSYEPGLVVVNSVSKGLTNKYVPVILVNTTNKTYTLEKD